MKTNRRRRSRPWERYMGFAKGTYVGSDKHLTIQVLLYFQYLTIAHRDVHPHVPSMEVSTSVESVLIKFYTP